MEDILSMLLGLSPILVMVVVFYFFLIRPQQKRQKQVSQMQQNLAKGDQIITIGGLHGTVDAIDEDVVVIKVNENNRLRFDRSAIRSVTQQEQA
jgi:preprotein translocase subunit YajC